jgi:hypothetical protein
MILARSRLRNLQLDQMAQRCRLAESQTPIMSVSATMLAQTAFSHLKHWAYDERYAEASEKLRESNSSNDERMKQLEILSEVPQSAPYVNFCVVSPGERAYPPDSTCPVSRLP